MPAEKVEKKSTKTSKKDGAKTDIKKKSKDFVAQNFRNAVRDCLTLPTINEETKEHDKLQLNALTCKLAAKAMQDYVQRLAVRAAKAADEDDRNTILPEHIVEATKVEPVAFPQYLLEGVSPPVRKTREMREAEAKAKAPKAAKKTKKQAMEVSA